MRGLRLIENGTVAVRADLVDPALVPGGGEYVARFIDGESPDVLVRRIEKHGRLTRGIDLVDFSVGRRRGVDTAAGGECQRVDLELFGVEEHRAFAGRIDLVQLTFVSAADVHRSVRGTDH